MARPATDINDVPEAGGRDRKPTPADLVDLYKFPEKKWTTVRLVGPLYAYAGYWIRIKKKDGNMGSFYTEAPSFDPATRQRDPNKYDPWRDAASFLYEQAKAEEEAGRKKKGARIPIQYSPSYYGNIISRDQQRKLLKRGADFSATTSKERKTGFKDKDSDSETPCYAVRLTASLANKIKSMSGLNTREDRKTGQTKSYPVSHPKFGCDVRIYYDPDKAPADQYQVVPGDPSRISEEEESYLLWDCSNLSSPDSDEEVKKSFERWATTMEIDMPVKKTRNTEDSRKAKRKTRDEDLDEDEDDFEEEETPKSRKSKATTKKPAKKSRDDDDFDDDDDDGDDFDDDDEDEAPARKSKKVVKKPTRKSRDDEDDEDEDDDFDDEDEEEKPRRGKAKAPAKKPVKKTRKSSDDDDEDDFDDDEDEDDEPPKKKASSKKPARRSRDDEDDDDDFDDEDEDDEPVAKKKPAAKKPVKKPTRKSRDDEDDEDEDDDFDDEDEDDDPSPKKKAASKKSTKRSRDEDEDDDDDFDDEDEDDDPPPKKKPARRR